MFRPTLLVAACFAAAVPLGAEETPPHNGKNVLVFVVDDQGFQAGCCGDKIIQTPSIDRLAATGTLFTRAGCTTASCSASRSVILTGLHNHATGHYGHSHDYHHFSTYETVKTLPVLLAGSFLLWVYRELATGDLIGGPTHQKLLDSTFRGVLRREPDTLTAVVERDRKMTQELAPNDTARVL